MDRCARRLSCSAGSRDVFSENTWPDEELDDDDGDGEVEADDEDELDDGDR